MIEVNKQQLLVGISIYYDHRMPTKLLRLSEQLRTAISGSEMSWYRIAKEVDLALPVLSRFMHGKSGLSVESIDKIGLLLQLKLTKPTKAKASKSKAQGKQNG